MTTDIQGGSATIYTFPARGRFAVGANREGSQRDAALASQRAAQAACGSGWYHEQAICDADSTRKN